jgi:hypothetical protein
MMKRWSVIGSFLAIILVVLVPVTSAIQIQTVKRDVSSSLISFEMLENTDAEELVDFIQALVKDSPQALEEFQHGIDEIENTPVSSMISKYIQDVKTDKNQQPQPRNDNQTFLEKIYWKIYNYRVFRLLISTLLVIYHPSKITLWRMMSWGIRLLRWTKIGILLGYIDPNQKPQTPTIEFQQDLGNNTLTVVTAPTDILWSDIKEIGEGSCDPFPEGTVVAGDMITNCTGIIVLQYVPTSIILGVFEFD